MVLTAAQVAAFFEDADQMAIPHDTVIQLQTEGIVNPDDLTDFDKTLLKEVAENLRKPSDRIPNPDPAAPAGSTIPRPAYVFGAKSQKRLEEADGKAIGTYDDNPMLNTMVYEIEFPDGQVKEYSANIIAENMLTQVDSEGFTITMMEGIIDYKKDEATAVLKADGFVVTRRGQRRRRTTTQGWKLLVKWKDGSEQWIPLKDMKESHPVETAEFAVARGIDSEPAFAWWVPYTLRKRDVILSAVKSRIRKMTHKFGIEIPQSVEHAKQIDKQNGNTLWQDALALEMTNVDVQPVWTPFFIFDSSC